MDNKRLPTHVSIIMDGNGRWATSRGEERFEGHKEGKESVRVCCEFAVQKGIKYLSLFAFSEENWNRPEDEVLALMSLMVYSIVNEKPTFQKNNIRFLVLGDKKRLSKELVDQIQNAEDETAHNTGLTLIVFLSYSGKWDIIQAVQKYADYKIAQLQKGEDVSELSIDLFSKLLVTDGIPDPDLIIRTSGEQRISNYLLWQSAYSEFYFTNTLWPDFRKNEFQLALDCFASRERRFGKTTEQLINK